VQQCTSKNSVNCWDLSLRQSAAKPLRRKVQRPSRNGVERSRSKRREPRRGYDMVLSARRRVAARKSGSELTNRFESNANAQIDGDEATFTAVTPTVRLGNYTQILRKTVVIADNLTGAIDEAGRRSELALQISKQGAELRRDLEYNLCGLNQAAVAGNNTTARKTASLSAFLRTNTSRGSSGADPTVSSGVVNAAATDGTQRAATEALLKSVLSSVWTEGGNPKFLMVGSFVKQAVSAFAGIAAQRYNATGDSPSTIIGAADVNSQIGVAA